ncbi:putative F-box protein At1g30920 [Papaver somniferum]|uniref:putative F-box protein At1g30920 n=1 Tax=Papaver somniferum TaxID=3469 RepID=UPI000E6F6CD3|nr:putative F-box protein At1g30920 [Papaver somniferum]
MGDLHVSLPIELILEFLSRLPVKSLTRLSCASKYLYNTINNQNQQFTKSHFINYSPKNPFLVFCINYYYGTGKQQQQWLFKSLFHTRDIKDDGNDNYNVHLSKTFIEEERGDFVGYCNGLICFGNITTEIAFVIDVWNSTTRELLRIVPPVVRGGRYKLMSCGFGFDSVNNEYKLVIIVFMFETKSLKCFLYTFESNLLGQKSGLLIPDCFENLLQPHSLLELCSG